MIPLGASRVPAVVVVDVRPVVARGLATAVRGLGLPAVGVSDAAELGPAVAGAGPPAVVVATVGRGAQARDLLTRAVEVAGQDIGLVVIGPLPVTAGPPGRAAQQRLPGPGVQAVLPPSCTTRQLVDVLVGVAHGQGHPPAAGACAPGRTAGRLPGDLGTLTAREHDVLDLLARGRGTREVAALLCVSPNTVRTHVNALLHKLGVHSRLRAVALYAESAERREGARRPDSPWDGEDRS